MIIGESPCFWVFLCPVFFFMISWRLRDCWMNLCSLRVFHVKKYIWMKVDEKKKWFSTKWHMKRRRKEKWRWLVQSSCFAGEVHELRELAAKQNSKLEGSMDEREKKKKKWNWEPVQGHASYDPLTRISALFSAFLSWLGIERKHFLHLLVV